jgi:hypothetical protein
MHMTDKYEWIDALLSGKYEQGHHQLKRDSLRGGSAYYCCLGVLCEIKNNLAKRSDYSNNWYSEGGTEDMPSDAFMDDIGLEHDDANQLAKLNDSEGWTFPEIAQWIQDNVEAG